VTTNRPVRWWLASSATAALLGMTSACSPSATGASGGAPATGPATPVPSAYETPSGTNCGTARTVINTPVIIKVTKGIVACTTALAIENDYTGLLKQEINQGKGPGNGGGAPVTVSGWTCQGFPTPQVLTNGVTSECHTASADVVAVLDLAASPPASPSAG
jgi:hypothetical protein